MCLNHSNEYLLDKIGFDTAEHEPSKVRYNGQNFPGTFRNYYMGTVFAAPSGENSALQNMSTEDNWLGWTRIRCFFLFFPVPS